MIVMVTGAALERRDIPVLSVASGTLRTRWVPEFRYRSGNSGGGVGLDF